MSESLDDEFEIEAAARWVRLTSGEVKIVEFLCKGFRPSRIALHLKISIETVRTHIRRVQTKLGIYNVTAIVAYAITFQQIQPSIQELFFDEAA